MFADLFDTDWASLSHAYGTAEGVPQILQGLASADPDERERALDDFLGAVHHQGDIYDSTVACLPFLFELVAERSLAGRGAVADLFASFGESIAGNERRFGGGDDEDEEEWRVPYRLAAELIGARAGEFGMWFTDVDPQVRSAAPAALAYFAPDAEQAVGLFEQRLAAEQHVECRIALIKAAADVAVHHAGTADRVADWLLGIVAGDADPGTRLAALVHVARSAPDRTVDDLAGRATALLSEISAHPGYPATPTDDRPATPTLVGAVRVMFAPEREGRTDAWAADLMRVLHDALAERVADRIALIVDQLRHPEPGRRVDALRTGSRLIGCWRGPYENLVRHIGEHLDAPEHPVRYMAALALNDTFDLAAPAADALAAQVFAAGPDAWNAANQKPQDPYRMLLLALARLGDARAVPGVQAALAGGENTSLLVQTLGQFGDYRYKFMPGLLRQLGDISGDNDPAQQTRQGNVLAAIRHLKADEAADEVTRILVAATRAENRSLIESALWALTAIGPAAQPAIPQVRRLTEHDDMHIAQSAIEAARAITQNVDDFVADLRKRLQGADPIDAGRLATIAATAGPAAAPLAEVIRTLTRSDDLWTRVRGASALIRITSTSESLLPILATAWQSNAYTRIPIAECVGHLGAQATSFLPLLRAELADPRRHTFRAGLTSNTNIPSDEKLLTLCAEAVELIAWPNSHA